MTPFEELLDKSKAIHLKKRADYTTKPDENPFENFTRANELISWFPSKYRSFASHIGTKLARIGSLLSNSKEPTNESLDDSFLDLVTYCALMYGFYKFSQETQDNTERITLLEARDWISGPPILSDQIQKQCPHTHINLNRRCGQCSKTISWLEIEKNYNLDKIRDTYIQRT
jgi:hypothetical protein